MGIAIGVKDNLAGIDLVTEGHRKGRSRGVDLPEDAGGGGGGGGGAGGGGGGELWPTVADAAAAACEANTKHP